jgi:signal transduction histidine kinase
MRIRSIRRDLIIRCGAGVGVLLSLLSLGIYFTVRHGLYLEIDQSLQQSAALLSNQLELEYNKVSFEWQEGVGTNRSLIDDGLFQYWDETTGKTTRSQRLASWDLPEFCGKDGAPIIKEFTISEMHCKIRAIGMRVYPYCIPQEVARMKSLGQIVDPHSKPYILVVARPTKSIDFISNRMGWILVSGSFLTLLIGFGMIKSVVRRSLRPIDFLTRQVRDRSESQIDSALDVPGELPFELRGLAQDFSGLLSRVAAIRQRERDFIRHASHELRTPIAGLQATLELALSKRRDAMGYVKYLETCRITAVESGELVKRLSSLARLGTSEQPCIKEVIDLESLTQRCLAKFTSALAERQICPTIINSRDRQMVIGDTALLRIILNNLLDNVVSHAPSNTEFRIEFEYSKEFGHFCISNPAPGLVDDVDRLFEPLFRAQAAGDSGDQHLGVGLTLSLDAALAMGGGITAYKTLENWIRFELIVPLMN